MSVAAPVIVRRVAALEAKVKAISAGVQLAHSSIDDGTLRLRDGEGVLVGRIGLQPDGSNTYVVTDAPTPLQPTDPICEPLALAINVTWDGNLIGPDGVVDAELAQFHTDVAAEVHVGATEGFIPDVDTNRGEIPGRTGGTVEVGALSGERWVRLMIRNQAGKYGPPSPAVRVDVSPLVDQAQFDDLRDDLDEAAVWIAVSGAQLDTMLGGPDAIPEAAIDKLWTNVVRSRKITTDMLVVGSGENLIPDPYFTDPELTAARVASSNGTWTKQTLDGIPCMVNEAATGAMFKLQGSVEPAGRFYPVAPQEVYRIRTRAHRVAGTASLQVTVVWVDATGAQTTDAMPVQVISGTAGWYDFEWTAPASAVGIEVWIGFAGFGSTSLAIGAPSVVNKADASLIVDGTIKGRHVDAESVAAEVGEFVEVKAENIQTGVMTAVITLTGQLATALTGTRTVINSAGLFHYTGSLMDFSATAAGVRMTGEIFTSGADRSGIRISPDSSYLGDGVIEFRASSLSNFPHLALESGPGGIPSFEISGPRISQVGGATAPAQISLDWMGDGTSRFTAEADLIDTSAGAFRWEGYKSGGPAVTFDNWDSFGLFRFENKSQGGTINLLNSGTSGNTINAKNLGTGGILNLESTEINLDGAMTRIRTTNAVTTGTSFRLDHNVFEVGSGHLWLGRDNSVNLHTGLHLARQALIESPADSGNLDIKARGNILLHATVAGTGNAWGASENLFYLGSGGNANYVRITGFATRTTTIAGNCYIASDGAMWRSTSLTEAKLSVEDVTEEQWRAVKELRPVTWFDRASAENLAAQLDGEEVEDGDSLPIYRQVGVLAEEVETAAVVGLATYGPDGELAGVGYERIAVLHQPWLLEHDREIEELRAEIGALRALVAL